MTDAGYESPDVIDRSSRRRSTGISKPRQMPSVLPPNAPRLTDRRRNINFVDQVTRRAIQRLQNVDTARAFDVMKAALTAGEVVAGQRIAQLPSSLQQASAITYASLPFIQMARPIEEPDTSYFTTMLQTGATIAGSAAMQSAINFGAASLGIDNTSSDLLNLVLPIAALANVGYTAFASPQVSSSSQLPPPPSNNPFSGNSNTVGRDPWTEPWI